ncbi:MAG TPA: ATP-binding protein [Thermoanaerobaculia bacterium]|nr:ATP-binding protein [Thermoanaerobaculia bacterium]
MDEVRTPVDLTNCDTEPIHTPGAIQPAGYLFACDRDGRLIACSANAAEIAGVEDAASLIGRELRSILPELEGDAAAWADTPVEVERLGRSFDVTATETHEALLVELEPAASGTAAAAIERQIRQIASLQRSRGVVATLQLAARSVREVVGHDRVMVYRFRPDGSGEVVVDEHAPDLVSFLGQRYPASDIPAQARRLYMKNVIRLIADVAATPSPLVPPERQFLDLSPTVLRSVSPIHLEYLRNMGVGASFSVSISIRGELWGLIAGHHREPRYIARNQRAYCQLLAQHIALVVEAEDRRELAAALEKATEAHTRIVSRASSDEDLVQAIAACGDDLARLVSAQGAAIMHERRIVTVGTTPPRAAIEALVAELTRRQTRSFATAEAPADLPEAELAGSAGVLAMNFNPSAGGWIVWFRPEAVHDVTWGGDPRKNVTAGPLGARLTPRGSFDAWVETVRGTSEPWTPVDLAITTRLRDALAEIALRKSVEAARLREVVLSTVGHDLRTPLSAIQMAAQLMDGESTDTELTASITASSRRMRRLLDNLMELSRVQSGGIVLQRERTDVAAIAERIAEESRLAFDAEVRVVLDGDTTANVDVVRVEQMLSNLVSNARHHGDPAAPVTLRVWGKESSVGLSVHNDGPEIPESLRSTLFDAFTSSHAGTSRGLGLGLYIVSRVVEIHGGTISVRSSAAEGTTFEIDLPRSG